MPHVELYSPIFLEIPFSTPVIIPNDIDVILIEVEKINLPGTVSPVLFIAGTDEDDDYSWYQGCINAGPYTTTTDMNSPRPDARFYITVSGSLLSINEMNYGINIFPNPTSNSINIDCSSTVQIENIYFYDFQGKKMNIVFENRSAEINDLPSGIYYLKIIINSRVFSRKIIKI